MLGSSRGPRTLGVIHLQGMFYSPTSWTDNEGKLGSVGLYEMGRCCAMGCSSGSYIWVGFCCSFFIVMNWEMGNCFSTRKSKTTAFCVEWPFRLCAWTTNKKNTMKCSMGKHSELDSPLCCSSSAPNQFNWTKMELCYPYYLKRRGLILLFCRILPIIPGDSGLQRISTADSL